MIELEPLQQVPLFHELPAAELEPLRKAAIRRACPSGEIIFRHGDVPEFFYVVERGQVDIVIPGQGEEMVLASFHGGSFFGELTVFDLQPRTATARTSAETGLICIPLAAVAALIERSPLAARQFISVIASRLRGANEQLSRLQIKNVNDVADQRMSFGERIADRVARFGGSWTFIIYFGVFLFVWMAVNTSVLLSSPPDPFPYIFLNLMLSCVAALQAPVIMMSQNRQSAKDRLQADEEFRINSRADIAVQQLHLKIDELRANLIPYRQTAESKRPD